MALALIALAGAMGALVPGAVGLLLAALSRR
jgi:hypothetical protein